MIRVLFLTATVVIAGGSSSALAAGSVKPAAPAQDLRARCAALIKARYPAGTFSKGKASREMAIDQCVRSGGTSY